MRAPVTDDEVSNWAEVVRLCRDGALHIRPACSGLSNQRNTAAEGQQACKDGLRPPTPRPGREEGKSEELGCEERRRGGVMRLPGASEG